MVFGQNLVPNPSFEQMIDNPSKLIKSNLPITYWYSPNSGSPDIINNTHEIDSSLTLSYSKDGHFFCRIAVYDKINVEYIANRLIKPLEPKKTYLIEFWVKHISTNYSDSMAEIGIKFYNDKMVTSSLWIENNPDIIYRFYPEINSHNWAKVSGTFTPNSKKSHFVIGVFKSQQIRLQSGVDIVIDDVQITPVSEHPKFECIYFEKNKSEVKSFDKSALHNTANYLINNKYSIVELHGHTDSNGSHKENMLLSRKRVAVVTDLLLMYGVNKSQIKRYAHGETKPLYYGSNRIKLNRRVELIIKSKN